eukprot:1138605-Pelagomonas_calceolata.AAC.1
MHTSAHKHTHTAAAAAAHANTAATHAHNECEHVHCPRMHMPAHPACMHSAPPVLGLSLGVSAPIFSLWKAGVTQAAPVAC